MLNGIVEKLKKEKFITTPLSIFISPVYIIRRGLYKTILHFSQNISGNVLDFGCGSKPYESIFRNADSYVGVDIEVSGHNHKDSSVDFFYDGKTLPFSDNNFDAVVCFEVLEHIFNIDEILTEIRRVMKDQGLFLISVPFAWDEHEAPYDFARYTSYGIKSVLERNMFEVIEIKKTTTYVLAVFQMFIAYLTQHVFPERGIFKRISQVVVIFPLNLIALLLNLILPKRYEYFCNTVVLAKKIRD